MFWTILTIVASLGAFAYQAIRAHRGDRDRYRRRYTYSDGIFVASATAVAVGFVGAILSFSFADFADTYTITERRELKALQDSSSVSGSFFLGIGGFGEDMKYHYYAKRDGAFYLDSIDPAYVGIVYTNETPAHVIITEKTKKTFWSWYSGITVSEREEFHIPDGSIKQDYTLDAK